VNVWTCSECGEHVTALDYAHYLAKIQWHATHCGER
jgi:ribosomal protein L37AE/L43A